MLDPVKNAKALGAVIIFFSVISTFFALLSLALTVSPIAVIGLVAGILGIVVGYGLFKTKAWAVYGFGVVTLLSIIIFILSNVNTQKLNSTAVVNVVFNVVVFVWFYSAIKRFKK